SLFYTPPLLVAAGVGGGDGAGGHVPAGTPAGRAPAFEHTSELIGGLREYNRVVYRADRYRFHTVLAVSPGRG
ncbi:hypothetical protein ACFWAX_08570, partial [Streptomyces sp. NPDC059956]|uniref:hypothetical protein n=1 Tax=Streptomyces sp. NPDC059956 TaxID=3347015 RepID=UPI00365B50FE